MQTVRREDRRKANSGTMSGTTSGNSGNKGKSGSTGGTKGGSVKSKN